MRRRLTQPHQAVRLDQRFRPHTVLLPLGGQMRSILGLPFTPSGTLTPLTSAIGSSVRTTAAGAGYWYRAMNYDLTQGFSLGLVIVPNDTPAAQAGYYSSGATNVDGAPSLYIAATNADLKFMCNGNYVLTLSSILQIGKPFNIIYSVNKLSNAGVSFGYRWAVSVNGSLTTGTLTTVDYTPNQNEYLASGFNAQSSTDIGLVFTSNYQINDYDMIAWSLNPWQLFRPYFRDRTRYAGSISQPIALDGAAVSVAMATGQLNQSMPLSGSAASASVAAGTISFSIAMNGAAIAQATGTGAMGMTMPLAGPAADQAAAAAALGMTIPLAGTAAGQAAAAAALGLTMPLAGNAADIATAAAALGMTIPLSGSAADQAAAIATLNMAISLAGSAADQAATAASLQMNTLLTGAASAQASAAGTLSTAEPLTGTATDQATATGNLEMTLPLAGTATDQATAIGGLGMSIALSGAAIANVLANANITFPSDMTGHAAAEAIASGTLSMDIPLSGQASAIVSGAGDLRMTTELQGAAFSINHGTGNLIMNFGLSGQAADLVNAGADLTINVPLNGHALAETLAIANMALSYPIIAMEGIARAVSSTQAELYVLNLTGFRLMFSEIDDVIMETLGDDIILITASGVRIPKKCVLRKRPGSGQGDAFVWDENIMAKIDTFTVVVDMLEKDIVGISKNWSADYLGSTYDVSETVPKGDLTVSIILNKPGNIKPTPSGWQ